MRARDKPSFPVAPSLGLYGCVACGTYHRVHAEHKLSCSHCRSARPLIRVGQRDGEQTGDTPDRRETNPTTDTE